MYDSSIPQAVRLSRPMDFPKNERCLEQSKYLNLARLCAAVGVVALLSGCSVDPATQSVLDTYHVIRPDDASGQPQLNPDLKYLRVQTGGRELFMTLGYIDQTAEGSVEVWYSAKADVLRLRDGRVVGVTMKTGVNWRSVTFSHLPAWDAIGDHAEFERTRDQSPGYRYGIKEQMTIRRIQPPDDSQLKIVPAASLAWFEESVQGAADSPPARYGVVMGAAHQVVYGEQCLSNEFCFSWQRWPYSGKGAH